MSKKAQKFQQKFKISKKVQNFQKKFKIAKKSSKFPKKFKISKKVQNFQKSSKFPKKFKIAKKVQNFQKSSKQKTWWNFRTEFWTQFSGRKTLFWPGKLEHKFSWWDQNSYLNFRLYFRSNFMKPFFPKKFQTNFFQSILLIFMKIDKIIT